MNSRFLGDGQGLLVLRDTGKVSRQQVMEFDNDKVYQLHNQFMREFTPIAHRIQLPSPSG